jgi:hypothetical protein
MEQLRAWLATVVEDVRADPLKVGAFLTVLSFVSSGVVALLNRHEEHRHGKPR